MFTRATRLRFGAEDTPDTVDERGSPNCVRPSPPSAGGRDVDTLTEVLWAALHGLTTLGRSDRLRPGRDTDRIELLVAQFRDASLETRKKASRGRTSGREEPPVEGWSFTPRAA